MTAAPSPLDLTLLDLCAKAWDDPSPTYAAGDCRIYRTDTDDYTILVAAGSRTLADWVTNLKVGWRADASAVLPLILADVPFQKPLVLAGHSKGGADIQDLVERLALNAVRMTTFEAPGTGSSDITWRMSGMDYTHRGDPVWGLPLGASHPRPLFLFDDPALPIIDPHRDPVIDPFINHHLTTIRPALVRLLAAQGG